MGVCVHVCVFVKQDKTREIDGNRREAWQWFRCADLRCGVRVCGCAVRSVGVQFGYSNQVVGGVFLDWTGFNGWVGEGLERFGPSADHGSLSLKIKEVATMIPDKKA